MNERERKACKFEFLPTLTERRKNQLKSEAIQNNI